MRLPKNFIPSITYGPILGVLCCSLAGGCGDVANIPASADTLSATRPTIAAKRVVSQGTKTVKSAETSETPAPAPVTGATESAPLRVDTITKGPEPTLSKKVDAAPETWTADFKAAQVRALAEGKDILMNFTGSDWCGWCIRLHGEVFDQAEFMEYAKKNLVLVELDFPQDRSRISEKQLAENEKLQNRFGVQGFPTILLTDAKGRPYAKSGYQRGGPQAYTAHLDELAKVRKDRDAALTAAEKLSGLDRAKELNNALQVIPPELILPAYDTEIEEIVRLDKDNQAGLYVQYNEQLNMFRFQQKLQEIVDFVRSTNDIAGALKQLDELDMQFADFKQGRLTANLVRLQLLEIEGRTDDVLKLADSILADKTVNENLRLKMYSTKLSALSQAKHFAKAIEVVDVVRAEFADDESLSAQLLVARAEFLAELGRKDESRAALKEAREMAGPGMLPMIDQAERNLFPTSQDAGDSEDGEE